MKELKKQLNGFRLKEIQKILNKTKMENQTSNFKIGIIGVGMVGGALKRYFEKRGFKLFLFDKGKSLGSVDEVNKADVIFICVPTPFNKKTGFDLSFVREAVSCIKGEKIIVIKSTVLPGTTEMLQKENPQHTFLFNPEFLSEATADYDMENPDRQLVGYTFKKESKEIANEILKILPRAPFEKIIRATEAEMVKYFNNTFNAIKVIFANQFYDLCQKLGIDYDIVKECAAKSKFIITDSHLQIFHKGYRGYGGKCLPKDIKALIQFADSLGVDLKLHKAAEEINNQLMRDQNIKDPENLSKRQ
jgi:UDPglucose 6-dehydrogenase